MKICTVLSNNITSGKHNVKSIAAVLCYGVLKIPIEAFQPLLCKWYAYRFKTTLLRIFEMQRRIETALQLVYTAGSGKAFLSNGFIVTTSKACGM